MMKIYRHLTIPMTTKHNMFLKLIVPNTLLVMMSDSERDENAEILNIEKMLFIISQVLKKIVRQIVQKIQINAHLMFPLSTMLSC